MKKQQNFKTPQSENTHNQPHNQGKGALSSIPSQKKLQQQSKIANQELAQEINKSTDMISSLIHEYLLKQDYHETLDIYQSEMHKKIKNNTYYNSSFIEINEQNILKLFTTGNKIEFFKQWNRLIPSHIKLKEEAYRKLEFFLEIYFAIYPILGEKNNYKLLKSNMDDFKKYLETKEIELSKTTEFLAYYALPYVPNPKEHPSYQQLFKEEWTVDIKEKIKQCIKNYLPSMKYPVLYDLVSGNDDDQEKIDEMRKYLENLSLNKNNDNNIINNNYLNNNNNSENCEKVKELENENTKLIEEIKKLKSKEEKSKITLLSSQKTWSNLALKLIDYSFELLNIAKSNNNNPNKNNEDMSLADKINRKLVKYQNFLKKNKEELEKDKNNNNVTNNSNLKIDEDEIEKIANSKYEDSIINNNNNLINNNILNNNINNNIISNSNNKIREEDEFSKSLGKNQPNNENENIDRSIQIDYDPSFLIDIKRVTSTLIKKINSENNNEKIYFIFRELRLRISRRSDILLKQLTLYSIFYYDLLGALSKNSTIVHNLLLGGINNNTNNSNNNNNNNNNPNIYQSPQNIDNNSNFEIVLETIKFLNAIANYNKGRNYLLAKNTLIDDIVQCMIKEKEDSELRQNCLGIIQKFTLRAGPQNRLIELNVIQYIVDIFTYESSAISDYTIEYGLALIMNLSLRKSGREKFEKVADRILQILLKFMSGENVQVFTCINGTLYSLLKRQKFKNEAKKIGLENILKNLKIDNLQIKKQFSYILEELNSPSNDDDQEEYDENFEEDSQCNDNDEFSAIDEYCEGDSINEVLLEQHYKILGEYIIRNADLNKLEMEKINKYISTNPNMTLNKTNVMGSVSTSIRPEDGNMPLRRPTTPMTNLSMTGNSQLFGGVRGYKMTGGGGYNPGNNNNVINNAYNTNNNNDNNNEAFPEDTVGAFKTKDKLIRTPPRNYNNNNNK